MDIPAVVAELKALAKASADGCCLAPEQTIEWEAAAIIETAVGALHEIMRGEIETRTIVLLALWTIEAIER